MTIALNEKGEQQYEKIKKNDALKKMETMINEQRFALPPFCHFTPAQWQEKGHDYDEVRDNMLGWDITDFGLDRCVTVILRIPDIPNLMRKSCYFLMRGRLLPCTFTGAKWRISSTAAAVMC